MSETDKNLKEAGDKIINALSTLGELPDDEITQEMTQKVTISCLMAMNFTFAKINENMQKIASSLEQIEKDIHHIKRNGIISR